MKLNRKVFMTTKKGQVKGTKDVYIVNEAGQPALLAENIVAVVFTSKLPKGVVTVTEQKILLMSGEDIVVDALHTLEVLSEDSLPEKDKEMLEEAYMDLKAQTSDEPKINLDSIADALDALKDLGKGVKIKAQDSFGTLQDVLNELKATNCTSKGLQEESKADKTPKASAEMTATGAMDEIQEMIKAGKVNVARFRELIPEGSFIDFAKKLSEETNDASFYQIAKVLHGIGALK